MKGLFELSLIKEVQYEKINDIMFYDEVEFIVFAFDSGSISFYDFPNLMLVT